MVAVEGGLKERRADRLVHLLLRRVGGKRQPARVPPARWLRLPPSAGSAAVGALITPAVGLEPGGGPSSMRLGFGRMVMAAPKIRNQISSGSWLSAGTHAAPSRACRHISSEIRAAVDIGMRHSWTVGNFSKFQTLHLF